MTQERNTPRTDAEAFHCTSADMGAVDVEFAEELELEIMEVRHQLFESDITLQAAEAARDSAMAELAAVREALELLHMEPGNDSCDECGGDPKECPPRCCYRIAEAALSTTTSDQFLADVRAKERERCIDHLETVAAHCDSAHMGERRDCFQDAANGLRALD